MGLDAMMDAALELPIQLHQGLDAAQKAPLSVDTVENVILIGMGGSSIGGALAARLAEQEADRPMQIVRNHEPPGFVGSETLVIATSYSGETTETLDATRACLESEANVAAVTTGGKLGPLVKQAGGPVVGAPSGYQPRGAVGWLLGANMGLLDQALAGVEVEVLRTAADRLGERLPDLAAEGGAADTLAGALGPGVIGVVGHGVMGVVARRWAAELAENGKRLAFHAELPEMVHNQIVGWANEPGGAELVLVRSSDEGLLEAERLDVLAELAEDAGVDVLQARVGTAGVPGVLEALALGDLVSLHVARRAGVDPEPVRAIDTLKARLAEASREA